jgi:DNA-binding NarL/FixJ family response regulator/transcriptional regulator with XRE-family HTH domain
MTTTYSFGAWLRRRRLALDLSRDELARLGGCTVSMLKKIELDERRPSRQLAALLADRLALPPDERTAFVQSARAERAAARLGAPADLRGTAAAHGGLPQWAPAPAPDDHVGAGQAALDRGAWSEARACFEAALRGAETPEALEGLAAASWWLEDSPAVFAARERAYRLVRAHGDRRAAGRLATELGYDYAVFPALLAVSSGWLQRAHRLLDDLDPLPEQVWLALREAELAYHNEGDMDRVRRLANHAMELASRLGLLDPQMMGLAIEGLALVGLGEVADGMRRLDEATAAAVAGEVQNYLAVAVTLCCMVWACERVRDIDRAGQWCDQFMAYCRRNDLQAHLAFCRAHYASVLTSRGHWDEAEEQLAEALEGLRCRRAWSLPVLERLGELRRRQGRLEEAAQTFERARPDPAGVIGTARVALDRGDHALALELVATTLRRLATRDRVERIAPLELLVQIHCARGEVADAESALQELEAIAGIVRTDGLLALAGHGRGLVALTAADAGAAVAHLEDALGVYEQARLPFDAARVRLDLARALRTLGRRDLALKEARTACDAFRGLGAAGEASRAAACAAGLAGTAEEEILSPREMEVLTLLTRGGSNQQIADALVLSKHTVRRHVSNILTKLDVPSRTAAVAYALEHKRA